MRYSRLPLLLALSAASQAQTQLYEWYGSAGIAYFGSAVSGIGDVNGDGIPDVVVAARFDLNGFGSATVFSGADGSVLYSLSGDAYADGFGYSASEAGDINGDGVPDFIIGAPFDDNFGTDSGSARVFSGATGGVLYTFYGSAANDTFGYAVDGAGDVNGDGRADLIIGAHNADNMGFNSGTVKVYSGLNGSVLYTFHGDDSSDFFGFSVAGAGDLNGDGRGDLVIGAFTDEAAGAGSGSVRILSGLDGSILQTINGSANFDQFGYSVSGVGDVNGDGRDDFIVGAASGYARVYSGLNFSVLHTFNGTAAGDRFGVAVSGAGDVNGDGRADLIVGAEQDNSDVGYARVFSGIDGAELFTRYGTADGDRFGAAVGSAGDIDGDGYDDVIIGAFRSDFAFVTDVGAAFVYSGAPIIGTNYCTPAVANSSGLSAEISAAGSDGVADADFHLIADRLPTNEWGYFIASQSQAFIPNAGGSQGHLCMNGNIARFVSLVQSSGGTGSFGIQVDLSSIPTSPAQPILAGQTWYFQAWFRDYNPSSTSNFTDGLSVSFH